MSRLNATIKLDLHRSKRHSAFPLQLGNLRAVPAPQLLTLLPNGQQVLDLRCRGIVRPLPSLGMLWMLRQHPANQSQRVLQRTSSPQSLPDLPRRAVRCICNEYYQR